MSSPDRDNSRAAPPPPVRTLAACWAALLLALLATYSNHFENGFHFDDSHTVVENPYIRDLGFLPTFFTDGRTLSVHADQQGYRPLIPASLAVDYWLGGGLKPFWFHLSTFGWYLVLLVLMDRLFVRIMDKTAPAAANRILALFAVAWYALHPVNAETLNYIWQRGEVYSTLGVVAGLVTYQSRPDLRRFGLYLLPPLVGMFAKQTATMFAPLLFLYILLFESQWALTRDTGARQWWPTWPNLVATARASAPAFAVSGAYYLLQRAMTAPTFDPGGLPRIYYWLTQPLVLFHYFKSFFLPTQLSGDSDRQLVTSLFSDDSVIGIAFVLTLLLAAFRAMRRHQTRPVAFGLLWFLVASLPTSLIPLGELENDHRMFFPFVGVVLAVCWAGKCLVEEKGASRWKRQPSRAWLVAGALALLVPYAYGAHARNDVWRTEETLWHDVTIKSPRNGRGLMNYGVQLMARGDYRGALQYFERAALHTPNYSTLHINLGIAYGGVRDDVRAEEHFRRAVALAPNDSEPGFFYARWLRDKQRSSEAVGLLQRSVAMNGNAVKAAHLLMQIYFERGDADQLKRLAGETLRRFPKDTESARYLAADPRDPLSAEQAAVELDPTPEAFVNLSLSYEKAGRHESCIAAAREALKLRPDYAEAYNNIAAANMSLKRWDLAVEAAREAVRLKPDFSTARNNLQYALSQQRLEKTPGSTGE